VTPTVYADAGLQSQQVSPCCPLCVRDGHIRHWARAQDVEYYTSRDWYDYYRCEYCDVLFLHPLPANRLREIYPANYYSYVSGKRSWINAAKRLSDRNRLGQILRRIHGDTLQVLDVGGGTGGTLDILRQVDKRVGITEVVDLDEGAEAAARAAGHGYVRCRFEDFSGSRRYDLILLLNLIEHVKDPVAVLTKARTLLAPGGRILVKTPNVDSIDARLFRQRSWGGYHCPRHWTLFTPESFSEAAKTAGLEVIRVSFTQGAPFWAISIFERLRQAGWVKGSADAPAPFHPIIPVLQAIFAAADMVRAPFSRTSQIFVEMCAGQERGS
jgi:SAM-dependent methyltransferase